MNDAAARIYRDSLIWDAHAGFELRSERDLETLSVWKSAGVGYLSVNVGYDVRDWHTAVKALALARRWIDEHDDFERVGTASEIERVNAAGRMAVTFDIEGMDALDGSVDMVRLYHDLGVRQMLFAYNLNNQAGGGCHDVDVALTDFGRAVVREMNLVGMLVDCSHSGYRTTMEAMEISEAPVIFSHSNSRALRDHERNITDEQAKACAATGGVVGVNGIGAFLGENDIRTSTITHHIAHYIDLIGAAHVGIGLDYFHTTDDDAGFSATLAEKTDFWPPAQYPGGAVDCAAPSQIAEIARDLDTLGVPEVDIRGILGGNFKRVAEQVWK
jgi:membrane dipeptidase